MERLHTGSSELDLVLGGGLPVGALVIIAGSPGTGKTILAQQICFANATPERKAIYYSTVSEPPSKLISHLETFDFFDKRALVDRVELINLGDLLEGEDGGNIGPVLDEVVRKVTADGPAIVVIDSAKALRDFASDPRMRIAVYNLAARVAPLGCTLLFLGEYSRQEMESASEFSLADGIVELAYESREPVDVRWLRVLKMRSSEHLEGRHSIRITRSGLAVFPRLEAIVHSANDPVEPAQRISSGVPALDEMMDGGLPAAEATAVLGPSGSGKTVVALEFIVKGLEDGERCLYVSFQERVPQLIRKAASFGWDLGPALESGQLTIYHVPQGELNLDVVATVIRERVRAGGLRRVVLDSLAELVLAARESDRFPAYSRALVGLIQSVGASLMVTGETTTLGPTSLPAGGLSFLFQNVIFLRYIELDSEIRRAIGIIKMRDSDHARGLRQVEITSQGFQIGEKLEGLTGLLGWSALRVQGDAVR
jgi:circadian clock protein KaiC